MEDFQGGDERPATRATERALYAAADVAELLGMAQRALCRTQSDLDGEPAALAGRLARKLEYLREEVDVLRYQAACSSAALLGAEDAVQWPENVARPSLLSGF